MFPGEAALLMAIVATRDSGKKLLARPVDVVGGYIGYLYDSLLGHGYLKKDGPREYQITPRGREALSDFLRANKASVRDTLKTLEPLGIRVDVAVDGLERELLQSGGREALSPVFSK